MKKATGFFTRGLPYGREVRDQIYHSFQPRRSTAINNYFNEREGLSEEFNRIHIDETIEQRNDDRSLQRAQ